MKKLLQTDCRNKKIRDYGCNFRTLLSFCEDVIDRVLTIQEIELAYYLAVYEYKCMNENCLLKGNLHKLFEIVGWIVDKKIVGVQVGSILNGVKTFWGNVERPYNFTCLWGVTKHGYHYRAGDKVGNLIFDPDPNTKVIYEKSLLLYSVGVKE
jgi:hypothetical protein